SSVCLAPAVPKRIAQQTVPPKRRHCRSQPLRSRAAYCAAGNRRATQPLLEGPAMLGAGAAELPNRVQWAPTLAPLRTAPRAGRQTYLLADQAELIGLAG